MSAEPTCGLSDFYRKVIVGFTTALAAEVRQQEDHYDAEEARLREVVAAQTMSYTRETQRRYPPDSQLYREHIENHAANSQKELQDGLVELAALFPLGHKDADPDGALTASRLRPALMRHLQRIEAERRTMAVAAGDGASPASALCASSCTPSAASSLLPLSPSASAVAAGGGGHLKEEGEEASGEGKEKRNWGGHHSGQLSQKGNHLCAALLDVDNGVYLTPHPTAPGAPFPRYVSTSNTVAATAPSQPAFVVPTAQPRVSTPSAPKPSSPRRKYVPAAPRAKRTSSPAVTRTSPEDAAKDTVMQLWREVWCGQRLTASQNTSTTITGTDEASNSEHAAAAPASAALLRPSAAMVRAEAAVELRSYQRERQRCVAQQRHVLHLLEELEEPARQRRGEAERDGASKAELRALHQQLTKTLRQLDAQHASHAETTRELLNTIVLAPVPLPSKLSAVDAQAREAISAGASCGAKTEEKKKRQRRPSTTKEAASMMMLFSPQTPVEAWLHLPPHQLVKLLAAARAADSGLGSQRESPTDGNSDTVFFKDVPLPSLEEDREASDLDRYLWPVELERRVRHVLVGQVVPAVEGRGGSVPCGLHLSLSQNEVRDLETGSQTLGEEAAATAAGGAVLSQVPHNLDKWVVEFPRSGRIGWLYVQGRGETVAEQIELL